MDFFAPELSRTAVSAAPTDAPDPFAEAIGRRFSGPAAPMLTARLIPDESPFDMALPATQFPLTTRTPADVVMAPPTLRSTSSQGATTLSNMNLGSPGLARVPSTGPANTPSDIAQYTAVTPKDLSSFLALVPPPLILDVRSSGSHTISHVRGAISLSVPSTLLKRPKFSLTNLSTMIASVSARNVFDQWPSATRILVYDSDVSRLVDGSGVLGLLRKFEASGFKGELAWLVGGHNAVARLSSECLESAGSPSPEPETVSGESSEGGFLRANHLPQSAFQQSSTTGLGHLPNKIQASNPFYDNIRQNQELSHGITERIPLSLPQEVLSRKDDISVPWVRTIVENSDKENGIEALAMQFYRVELGEQRRLQGVMSHHSKETYTTSSTEQKQQPDSNKSTDPFPFSITAGVEKGSKNRYKNIWPYEHARVRLQAGTDDGSDYVNASHVQPRGTNLSYIATQGPMPTTYDDFWMMVWEQNVHVIVMLTRQVEGNQLKCGDYWSGGQYGPFRLRLIAVEGGEEEVERITGFDFGQGKKCDPADAPNTIRRTFALSHTGQPHTPPRKVVQFQFLSWLDMNVPETPDGLLELVKDVREAADEAERVEGESAAPSKSPVLVHCSAGVGRTGSFVAIDAILDGVRHDMDAQRLLSDAATTSSDTPSDSDPENGNPSTDSNPSPRFRRGSHPEAEIARGRPTGLHMTATRQRQRSLRKAAVGATKGLGFHSAALRFDPKTVSPPSDPESTGVARALGTINMNGADAGAGATSARLFTSDTNTLMGTSSESSASSFNFSTMAPSSSISSALNDTTANANKLADAPPLLSQSTRAWSSNVARSVSKPDLVDPLPVPASSSTSTPRPDSAMKDVERDTFDYMPPRSLVRPADKPASPLAGMDEPIREVLEDMREQRMSLCQSLRQYVFVHRAVVEGVLAMIDEEKERVKARNKKRSSPRKEDIGTRMMIDLP